MTASSRSPRSSASFARSPALAQVGAARLARSSGRLLDRLDDLQIARAAAEIAGQRFADPLARRMRLAIEQRLGGDQNARRAVAALRGAAIGESSCSGCSAAVLARPSTVVTARPPLSAASARHDSTGSPSTSTAHAPHSPSSQPCLVPGELQILAQHFEQGLVVVDQHLDRLAVDGQRQSDLAQLGRRCRSSRLCTSQAASDDMPIRAPDARRDPRRRCRGPGSWRSPRRPAAASAAVRVEPGDGPVHRAEHRARDERRIDRDELAGARRRRRSAGAAPARSDRAS